jgi:chemotaxis receptor (MCP) glutamine deamidase CheD
VQAQRQHDRIPDDFRLRLLGAGLDARAVVAEDAAGVGQRRVEVEFDQRPKAAIALLLEDAGRRFGRRLRFRLRLARVSGP